jgi:hypothetical protein
VPVAPAISPVCDGGHGDNGDESAAGAAAEFRPVGGSPSGRTDCIADDDVLQAGEPNASCCPTLGDLLSATRRFPVASTHPRLTDVRERAAAAPPPPQRRAVSDRWLIGVAWINIIEFPRRNNNNDNTGAGA